MFIEDYIARLEQYLSKPQVIDIQEHQSMGRLDDQDLALIKLRVFFWDRSYLDLYETVDTSQCYPDRLSYAYQYMSPEEQVFRYDNAHEYSELNLSREHKHVGAGADERVESSAPPSHSKLFDDISEYLLDRADLADATSL